MYTVIIVDDEILVRMGLKTIIEWEKFNLELVGEASDGEAALRTIEERNIDIVITDLLMPKTDGLTLIKTMKEKGYKGKIIILSNHNDFELVKEALKLGVSDYLLKLSIKQDELVAVLQKAINDLDKEREKEEKKTKLLETVNESKGLIISNNFMNVLEKRLKPDLFFEKAKELNFNLKPGKCYLLYLKIDNLILMVNKGKIKDKQMLILSTLNIIQEIVRNKLNGDAFIVGDNLFLSIVPYDDNIENDFKSIILDLSDLVKLYLNITISIVYSPQLIFPEDLIIGYELCKFAFQERFYTGNKSVIEANMVVYSNSNENIIFLECLKDIEKSIEYCNFDELYNLINKLFTLFRSKHAFPEEVLDLIKGIITYSEKSVTQYKFFIEQEGIDNYLKNFNCAETLEDVKDTIFEYFKFISNEFENYKSGRHTNAIHTAIEYIKENYRKRISVKEISGLVKFNYSYFCRLFKQEMGVNISEYIINYRIQKAKESLSDLDNSIKAAANISGFDDQFHFSKQFKKIVGCSPKDYRKTFKVKDIK